MRPAANIINKPAATSSSVDRFCIKRSELFVHVWYVNLEQDMSAVNHLLVAAVTMRGNCCCQLQPPSVVCTLLITW